MQGTQSAHSHTSLKKETIWFKTKLVSQFLTFSFLLSQPFYLSYLHAAPVGGNVIGGTGSISQSDLTTTINQTSQNLAVNWQSFDVNSNEKVNFVQPNSSSIALNRILGNNGSVIQGQINANGQVFLVNPNGILFTNTATVNEYAGEIELHAINKTLLAENSVTSAKALSSGQGGLVKVLGDKVCIV